MRTGGGDLKRPLNVFLAFYFVVQHYYVPTAASPQNAVAENLSKDLEWKATNASRRAALKELREAEASWRKASPEALLANQQTLAECAFRLGRKGEDA